MTRKFTLSPILYLVLALAVTLLVLAVHASDSQAQALTDDTSLEDLWMDMRIGPPLVDLFNDKARPDDIARIDRPEQILQLAGITTGRKLVVFRSIAEIEQFLPQIAGEIDIVGYNVEQGGETPAEEQADLLNSVQQVRALVDEYGLELAIGPDQTYAETFGVVLAPYADIFVLQIQRQQTNTALVEAYVSAMAPALRAANPNIQISVQVRTEGEVEEITRLLEMLQEQLDGVSILTSPDTVNVTEELVARMRPGIIGSYMLLILGAVLVIVLAVGGIILRRRII